MSFDLNKLFVCLLKMLIRTLSWLVHLLVTLQLDASVGDCSEVQSHGDKISIGTYDWVQLRHVVAQCAENSEREVGYFDFIPNLLVDVTEIGIHYLQSFISVVKIPTVFELKDVAVFCAECSRKRIKAISLLRERQLQSILFPLMLILFGWMPALYLNAMKSA